jgi:hypothetical protein
MDHLGVDRRLSRTAMAAAKLIAYVSEVPRDLTRLGRHLPVLRLIRQLMAGLLSKQVMSALDCRIESRVWVSRSASDVKCRLRNSFHEAFHVTNRLDQVTSGQRPIQPSHLGLDTEPVIIAQVLRPCYLEPLVIHHPPLSMRRGLLHPTV